MQTVESKNANILNRFESKGHTGSSRAYVVTVEGERMRVITQDSKEELLSSLTRKWHPKIVHIL